VVGAEARVSAADDRAVAYVSDSAAVSVLIDQVQRRRLIAGEARPLGRRSIVKIPAHVFVVEIQPCLEQPSLKDFASDRVGAVAAALAQESVYGYEWKGKKRISASFFGDKLHTNIEAALRSTLTITYLFLLRGLGQHCASSSLDVPLVP
jgi:hypothetical protein